MATKKARTPVELPTPLVARATSVAKRRRRSVEVIVAAALERYSDDPPTERKAITRGRAKKAGNLSDLFTMVRQACRDIPEAELKKLPRDGAQNHDRYIYGRP